MPKTSFKFFHTKNDLPEETLSHGESDSQQIVTFSQAISNCVEDGGSERLNALSCFDARKSRKFYHGEMRGNYLDFSNNQYGDINDQYSDDESYSESCDKYFRFRQSQLKIFNAHSTCLILKFSSSQHEIELRKEVEIASPTPFILLVFIIITNEINKDFRPHETSYEEKA
ncbi:hypothetical protein Glove_219g19 [Diversispora epigaea]|uniref:Uncharacterized protein n=1 Tax=Diversispora epigaea TaxID=1348612 RepID=A0A397IQ36_9GLOM|nr:hypothetical protein Glove_219g19 [Diversispora epigaea]